LPLTGFGARFGGFYAPSQFRQLQNTPLVAKLDDGAPGLVTTTSRGALVRLDATQATFAEQPKILWQRERTNAAQIVPKLVGGQPGIVAVEHHLNADDRVVALTAGGATRWNVPISGQVLADMVTGNLDGDGIPDVVVEHGDLGDLALKVTALSGANGATLWSAGMGTGNRQPPGGALADWNGDGRDDFVIQFEYTFVLDGKNGALMMQGGPHASYYTPLLFDVNGDGQLEATLYAGYTPAQTLSHDLSATLWQGPDIKPLTYGALLSCPGQGPMLLGGSWEVRPQLGRTLAGGPNAGMSAFQILAGGKVFPDVKSASAAGAKTGQLASPSVHTNLAGDDTPIAVIGSGDGWIYGVEACTGKLRFAHAIGAPVGAISFGDANGDGVDEIIASAADGHLYSLRQSPVPAPSAVNDVDPRHGIVEGDVDDITFDDGVSELAAAWTAVPGADAYEVAWVRDQVDGGGFVSAGPWQNVGPATSAAAVLPGLTDGKRYFAAVRAIRGGDRSPDTLSDGVRVHAPKPRVPGDVLLTGRSCVYFCGVGQPGPLAGGWAAVAVLALALRRRAKRLPRRAEGGRFPAP
jgi:hypothetical protein